ncbi:hypothetical protein Syun_023517 [Stephania yunnanensis]|uniref:SPX domain-containing protein n=1 Tax=Stephania yunnanensis TaxID=152371 RepID=A0AAP0I3D3_9MAGN
MILINDVEAKGSEKGRYETMFMMSADDGGENELVFFRRLDDEFNKVNQFYRKKVEEFKSDEHSEKQMEAHIAFRIKVEKPEMRSDGASEMIRLNSEVAAPGATVVAAFAPSSAIANSYLVDMDQIQKLELIREPLSKEVQLIRGENENFNMKAETMTVEEVKRQRSKATIEISNNKSPHEILNHVRVDNAVGTPRSTIKSILKVTSRHATRSYLEMVDKSYIGSFDEVNRLIQRVESAFIKHFSNSRTTVKAWPSLVALASFSCFDHSSSEYL